MNYLDEKDFLEISEDYLDILCAEKSLHEFIKQSWHIVEPETPYDDGVHIEILCEYLEAVTKDQIKNLGISMPPRHMKSLTVSVFWFCWSWIQRPGSQWLYTSNTDSVATRDSMRCRLMLESKWFRNRWGDRVHLKKDQNEKTLYRNSKEGHRQSIGINGNITGENCNFLVGDDILSTKGVHSDKKRDSTIFDWDNGFSTRLNDKRKDHIILMQQRLHMKDPMGHVIKENQGDWTFLTLPAEFKKKTFIEMPLSKNKKIFEENSILWPKRFPIDVLEKEKSRLKNNYAAQYLQEPIPDGGFIFDTSLIPRISSIGKLSDAVQVVHSWDHAIKDKEQNDESAVTIYAQMHSKKWVLIHKWSGKAKYSKQKTILQDLAVKYPPHVILVEDKGNGSPLISELKQYTNLPIKAFEPKGDKVQRAQMSTPFIEAGNLYLLDGQPWLADLIMDLDGFPNIEYKDTIDTISQFCIWALGLTQKQSIFMDMA